MKLLQDLEDAKAKKKSLKPQVERRRRERMNRSLESLKTLLLQPKEEAPRRVEKAEILEHTVLFLQSTAEGGQEHCFQDGFSTCLQRAARFLGPEGGGSRLGGTPDESFAARLSRAAPGPAGPRGTPAARPSSSSWLLRKSSRSILRMLIHRSGVASCGQTHGESRRAPTTPHQPHGVATGASKQGPPQCHAASRSLWRPWP